MTESTEMVLVVTSARGDIAAERTCMRCKAKFWSEGFGERICTHCKSLSVWRSAAPGVSGHGQRRSSGRFS